MAVKYSGKDEILYHCKCVNHLEGMGYACNSDKCPYGDYQIKEENINFCSVGGNVSNVAQPDKNLTLIVSGSTGNGAELIGISKLSQRT